MWVTRVSTEPPEKAGIDEGIHMDAKNLTKFRKLLLEEKQRILNNSKHALKNELALSPGRS